MAYDPSSLTSTDTTSLDWALAWTRFLLHDTDASNEIFSDTELTAVLTVHSSKGNGSTYYRPHVAVSNLMVTDPDRATSESLLGSSVTVQSPGSLARAIKSRNRWIDDAIEAASGERPTSGRTLLPGF